MIVHNSVEAKDPLPLSRWPGPDQRRKQVRTKIRVLENLGGGK
jgi:hypothetical protein